MWNKLIIIKTPERGHWLRSGVFIINFEYMSGSSASIVHIEKVNTGWVTQAVTFKQFFSMESLLRNQFAKSYFNPETVKVFYLSQVLPGNNWAFLFV